MLKDENKEKSDVFLQFVKSRLFCSPMITYFCFALEHDDNNNENFKDENLRSDYEESKGLDGFSIQ